MCAQLRVEIRIPAKFRATALKDLERPHPFALERVGFFSTSVASLADGHHLVLVTAYHPVPDDHYLDDPTVGACIGPVAIRAAMQRVLDTGRGQIHVHMHAHSGTPAPSRVDRNGLPPIVRSLATVGPSQASGYLILSMDAAWAEMRVPGTTTPVFATKITVVGFPMRFLL